jgi:hypothetical protein
MDFLSLEISKCKPGKFESCERAPFAPKFEKQAAE